MSYAEERQKINLEVAKYEASLNKQVFEKFFNAGKEQELLIYETTFTERGNLFGYKRMMWQKFKLDEIVEEMKNPDYFFQHGWFFPENKPKQEQDIITKENKMAYHLHTSIPPQYFENAEFVTLLYKSLTTFWNHFYIENCKGYDISQLKFGYLNGIRNMQIKAMLELKNKIEILKDNQLSYNADEAQSIQVEQDKCFLKLTKLINTPLFQTDLQTSQNLYKKYKLNLFDTNKKENNFTKNKEK